MVATELRFAAGAVEAVVLPELGARLHRLRAYGHDLLRTPERTDAHERDPFSWGAYVMAPWCNRIDPVPVDVGARRVALEPNFPDGTAIHGQVYARPWEVQDDGTLRIAAGGDGWPWRYEVTLRIAAAAASLRLDLSLTNRSEDRMPAGIGLHPWFRRPLRVAINAGAVYESNTSSRPLPDPVRGAYDLRQLGEMAAELDATWGELADPPVVLDWPDLGVRATMAIRARTRYVCAASPAGRDAIAIEPQTHAPHGLRRLLNAEPGALAWLDPGQTLDLGLELAFQQRPAAPGVSPQRPPGPGR